MNEPFDLDGPFFNWCNDIWCAQRGDVSRLIAALRSDRLIDARSERMLRECMAALLAGEFRRGRGRPKRRGLDDIDLAEDLVRALKMCARANGKVRSIERAAIEIAAQRYEVSEDALYHRMHRAPKK